MSHFKRSQIGGVVGAVLLCAAWAAHAQESATNSSAGNSSGTVIGPPQLKDFQLEPRDRIVTQPAPQPQRPTDPPARAAPDPQRPASTAPSDRRPQPQPDQARRTDEPATKAPAVPSPAPVVAEPQTLPVPGFETPDAPVAATPAPPAAEPEEQGTSWWLYGLPLVALLLLGVAMLRRRGRQTAETEDAEAPAAEPVPAVRRDPGPRPWLELELKAERASFTATEWVVQFQLSVSNTGQSAARNLRIDVKLFNAGTEQDKEIGAFFRTAGRESTKLNLPGIQPGATGVIDGEVAMPLEEMRGMKVSDRTLFIPVVAVNGLYDWGEDRSGQTAKSYVVGRELQEPSAKMGAFRVDLGPRIWRTVGQRPHKLARRV